MGIDELQAIATIAQSITTAGVLLAWVYSERKARTELSQEIIDDWKDMRAYRITENRKQTAN